MELVATLSIACGIISLTALLALHFVSPEFKPSWRMVSEYAMGKYKWMLTLFFIFWSLCTLLGSVLLFNMATSNWALFGAVLVFISGIGAFMGGLFDIKHKLHGLSFMLGVPTLPIGALISCYHLIHLETWNAHKSMLLVSAHSLWISFVLMALSMVIMLSGFKKAGIAMGQNVEPPSHVPAGVVALNGYANRLLVCCYILWVVVVSKTYLSI